MLQGVPRKHGIKLGPSQFLHSTDNRTPQMLLSKRAKLGINFDTCRVEAVFSGLEKNTPHPEPISSSLFLLPEQHLAMDSSMPLKVFPMLLNFVFFR